MLTLTVHWSIISISRKAHSYPLTIKPGSVISFSICRRQSIHLPLPTTSKTVVNLSSILLDAVAQSVLSKGLNYAVCPMLLPTEDIICGAEKAICSVPAKDAEMSEKGWSGS
jgi:hypothetical protein